MQNQLPVTGPIPQNAAIPNAQVQAIKQQAEPKQFEMGCLKIVNGKTVRIKTGFYTATELAQVSA